MSDKPYTVYQVEGPPRGRWKRIVAWTFLGVVLVLLGGAGGLYAWFHGQVDQVNARVNEELRVALTEKQTETPALQVDVPESPSAMNILLLGSDRREGEEDEPSRSDTIILVHVDPDQDYLSVMSIPRDLQVKIPGHGTDKVNAAYALGGPVLTIRTIEQLTGIDINHYVEVDFKAFCDITDSLGGVYVDVDKRYYNDDPSYELINLAPGYQLLHGEDALDYVRFRHDLNLDFGRMERQQNFLTAMKEQAMGWDLLFKLPSLVSSVLPSVTTDLIANEILNLAYWSIRLDGSCIRRIALVGVADAAYVFVEQEALAKAVTQFLTPPSSDKTVATASPSSSTTSTTVTAAVELDGIKIDVLNANGRAGEAAAAGRWLANFGATVVTVGNAGGLAEETRVEYPSGKSEQAQQVAALLDTELVKRNKSVERVTVILGEDFALPQDYALPPSPDTIPAAEGWKSIARVVPFAVRAPAYLPEGYYFVEKMPPEGATYDIEVGNSTKPAFKMVYRLKEKGQWTDQYMGIMETTWLDAPAASGGREVRHEGITYTVTGTSDKVERVWWKADGVLYWVSNTLFHRLSESELLAVAQSMIRIPSE